MALANGLSSHLLQSLSPSLISSSLHSHTNTGTWDIYQVLSLISALRRSILNKFNLGNLKIYLNSMTIYVSQL